MLALLYCPSCLHPSCVWASWSVALHLPHNGNQYHSAGIACQDLRSSRIELWISCGAVAVDSLVHWLLTNWAGSWANAPTGSGVAAKCDHPTHSDYCDRRHRTRDASLQSWIQSARNLQHALSSVDPLEAVAVAMAYSASFHSCSAGVFDCRSWCFAFHRSASHSAGSSGAAVATGHSQ